MRELHFGRQEEEEEDNDDDDESKSYVRRLLQLETVASVLVINRSVFRSRRNNADVRWRLRSGAGRK